MVGENGKEVENGWSNGHFVFLCITKEACASFLKLLALPDYQTVFTKESVKIFQIKWTLYAHYFIMEIAIEKRIIVTSEIYWSVSEVA